MFGQTVDFANSASSVQKLNFYKWPSNYFIKYIIGIYFW